MPKISSAIASSGGIAGAEVMAMAGARDVPVTATPMVADCTLVLARKSSRGSMASRLSRVTMPRLKARRRLPSVKSPRRSVRPPMTEGAAGVPPTCTRPPISASSPRPRTNTACGALIASASRIGVALGDGGARRFCPGGGTATDLGAPGLLISRTSSAG